MHPHSWASTAPIETKHEAAHNFTRAGCWRVPSSSPHPTRGPGGMCQRVFWQVHRSLRAFSFLICTEPVPAAQFAFWLIKLSQTPWLISTVQGGGGKHPLPARPEHRLRFAAALPVPIAFPASSLHSSFIFLPAASSTPHQEVIAKAVHLTS